MSDEVIIMIIGTLLILRLGLTGRSLNCSTGFSLGGTLSHEHPAR